MLYHLALLQVPADKITINFQRKTHLSPPPEPPILWGYLKTYPGIKACKKAIGFKLLGTMNTTGSPAFRFNLRPATKPKYRFPEPSL